MTLNDLNDIAILSPFNMDSIIWVILDAGYPSIIEMSKYIIFSFCLFILPAEEHLTFAHHSFLVELLLIKILNRFLKS